MMKPNSDNKPEHLALNGNQKKKPGLRKRIIKKTISGDI